MVSRFEKHILPLVGKVSLSGFDKEKGGHVLSIQFKLIKHVQNGNVKKIKEYIAFLVQQWPDLNSCPIDQKLIKRAMDRLG